MCCCAVKSLRPFYCKRPEQEPCRVSAGYAQLVMKKLTVLVIITLFIHHNFLQWTIRIEDLELCLNKRCAIKTYFQATGVTTTNEP